MIGPDSPATPSDRQEGIEFFDGGGEMGALMRAHDWSLSPLGSPTTWPQRLRSIVNVVLTSRFAMWMGWGPDLTFFYNDAYTPTLGVKHGWALGRPSREVWSEIWSDIGPRIRQVLATGEATWDEALLLFLERSGYSEETYHTFSYSPLLDDEGVVAGHLCVVSEETDRVIGERRLRTLREFAGALADSSNESQVLAAVGSRLGENLRDLPFTLTYLWNEDGSELTLAAASGFPSVDDAKGQFGGITAELPWNAAKIWAGAARVEVEWPDTRPASLPRGAWQAPPKRVVAVPIARQAQARPAGILVVGQNPHRFLDDAYADFINLLAGQLASALAASRAYEEERRRAEALAEIDRAKTDFFSNVSHEFRTPLTLMLGPLEEWLADAGQSPSAPPRERVQTVYRNGLRLLKLVNSLLDFSRIEAGRMQATFEPTDLAALTADLASNFRAATDRAGLELMVECPPLPESVHVDRDMWEKIILNLMSNAFKFTFTGGIIVGIRAGDGAAELVVRDTGTGIPEAELPRLFERFHRIEGARGRSFEGSGIGLALVQELVRLHGGRVDVESEEGRGTTFTVTIPFGIAHLSPERLRGERTIASTAIRAQAFVDEALRWLPDAPSEDSTPLSRSWLTASLPAPAGDHSRVLLADDNADMRDYISRLLVGRHVVETAVDGQAALEAARRQRPDLILTDIMMPRLDGFGLLRAIRANPDLRDMPVIVLSARAGEEASVEGLDAGADDYLVKPFSARKLVARIDTALAMARLRRENMQTLRRLNEALEAQVEERTRERDRVWNIGQDLFVVGGLDGSYRTVNPAWTDQLGYVEDELIGIRFGTLVHPDDQAATRVQFDRLVRGLVIKDFDVRLRARDGHYRWYSWTTIPEADRFYGCGRDITARKELEDQLRQSQKMEAVGKLTGGVAHDFNNLLQVIGGNLQLLSKDIAGNERAEQRLRHAHSGVVRGSKLASQLLSFGRRQPLEPRVVNLGRVIRGMDDMLRRALGEGIEIETVVSGGLWNTLVDPSQVENALLNLAINARDAMSGQGKLTIETGNAYLDDDYADRHADVKAGRYVMMAMTDTGCGMTPDVLEHAFEPFFTTKPDGQGTGLGLSMVWGLVKQSDGHIKVYSEPGQGTTIRIYLPRSHHQEDIATEIDSGPITGGTETVLIVEDDEDVRVTVVDMLSDLGYRVLKARDAQGALAIIESGVSIDLLFTDVVMPGPLRSPELARKARERLPSIAVLFTSGYTENAIFHGGRLDEGVDLLSKPYTRESLARKIRHVLGNQQQRTGHAPPNASPSAINVGLTAEQAPARKLTVLLVEDDILIRLSTAEMLVNIGHAVLEAANAEDALARLGSAVIDVLVTDIRLPGMSGVELAIQARRQCPKLRVIFASGADIVPGLGDADALENATLLKKPYDERNLIEVLA